METAMMNEKLQEVIEMGFDEDYEGWSIEDCIHMATGGTARGMRELAKGLIDENGERGYACNIESVWLLAGWRSTGQPANGRVVGIMAELVADYIVNVAPQPTRF